MGGGVMEILAKATGGTGWLRVVPAGTLSAAVTV